MKAADIGVAIAWLEINEGDQGEMESCLAVAEFLKRELARREEAEQVRSLAKETGQSPLLVRKAIRSLK